MPLPLFLAFLGALFLGLKAHHPRFKINSVFYSIRVLLLGSKLAVFEGYYCVFCPLIVAPKCPAYRHQINFALTH